MKISAWSLLTLFFCISNQTLAHADVNLLGNGTDNDWKVQMYGFIDMDVVKDSTRSLIEVEGDGGLAKPGTLAGDNGRLFFTARDTRFGFNLFAPEQDGWKTKAKLEFDFFGYMPATYSVNSSTPTENNFWNGSLRLRQANFTGEKDDLVLVVGHTWSLFGWQPYFMPAAVTPDPNPGVVFQRTPQLTALQRFSIDDSNKLVAGLAIEKPSQADSNMPNFSGGLKYSNLAYVGGLASTYGDEKVEPLTLGLSATSRSFSHPSNAASTLGETTKTGTALALDLLLPIVPTSDGKPGSSLTFVGEIAQGTGYADAMPGWSGGLNPMEGQVAAPVPGASAYQPNLDAGFAGYDSGMNFTLVRLSTWNASLQFHFRDESHTWITFGASRIASNNVGQLSTYSPTKGTLAAATYYADDFTFVNIFHDCSKQIRVAFEYSQFKTTFVDNSVQRDGRYQASFWYRF